jgi:two-component system, NarL family, nitrate/nitrite response regulator NarL
MKSCLICDDHALVREALAGTIRLSWPDAQVTEAGDFPSGWVAARTAAPEIILADLMMPGAGPIDGIAGLMKASPASKLLVVTGTEDDALLLDLLDLGVAGFSSKTANSAMIDAAIRLILAGGRFLPPRMAELAAARADSGEVTLIRDEEAMMASRFSPRQRDVLRLMADGQSTKEIARALDLAPSTVKTHLNQIMINLGVKNRVEASNRARQLNMI